MYKVLAAFLALAVLCGYAGVQQVFDARQVGGSTRDGVETLFIAAMFAGLFIAVLMRKLRQLRQLRSSDAPDEIK